MAKKTTPSRLPAKKPAAATATAAAKIAAAKKKVAAAKKTTAPAKKTTTAGKSAAAVQAAKARIAAKKPAKKAAPRKAAAKKTTATVSGGLVIPAKIKPLLIPSVAGKAGYKPGTSLPKGEAVYSRAAIRGMNRAMMEGAAELAHAPKSLYGKMTDAIRRTPARQPLVLGHARSRRPLTGNGAM